MYMQNHENSTFIYHSAYFSANWWNMSTTYSNGLAVNCTAAKIMAENVYIFSQEWKSTVDNTKSRFWLVGGVSIWSRSIKLPIRGELSWLFSDWKRCPTLYSCRPPYNLFHHRDWDTAGHFILDLSFRSTETRQIRTGTVKPWKRKSQLVFLSQKLLIVEERYRLI